MECLEEYQFPNVYDVSSLPVVSPVAPDLAGVLAGVGSPKKTTISIIALTNIFLSHTWPLQS